MSSLKDRKRAFAESREIAERSQRLRAEIEMTKRYRERQGEFLGDMIGGFGQSVNTGRAGFALRYIPTLFLLGFGAAAVAGLYAATY